MKWKVMVSAPYMKPVIHRFKEICEENNMELILPPVNERLEENELLEWVKDVDGVICGDDRFTKKVIKSAKKLKVISKWGTGTDSIDKDTCREFGIEVFNTPNAFSEPVADSVMGYMLCFSRNLPWMDRNMRRGFWDKIHGKALRECTLGVIGVGNVGKAVVHRAWSFNMEILGNDLLEMPEKFIQATGIEMVSLEILLDKADFVSINCDLNPTSYHMMNERTFSLMKSTAVIINTARGPIIDEKALIMALRENKIAGAALDVFEKEPLPSDSPLRQIDNVMLAPHNANSSPEAWEKVHLATIKNLVDYFKNIKK